MTKLAQGRLDLHSRCGEVNLNDLVVRVQAASVANASYPQQRDLGVRHIVWSGADGARVEPRISVLEIASAKPEGSARSRPLGCETARTARNSGRGRGGEQGDIGLGAAETICAVETR